MAGTASATTTPRNPGATTRAGLATLHQGAAAAVRARRCAGRRAGPAGPDAGGASQAVLADARAALDRATSRAGSEAMLAPGPGAPIDREGRQRLRPGPWTPGHTEWVGGPEDRCPAAARPGPHDQPMQSQRYVPGAPRPRFQRFPWQVSREDPEWVSGMQRWVGYCLTGSVREEVAAFWYGQRGERQERAGQPASSDDGEYADSVSMSFPWCAGQQRRRAGARPGQLAGCAWRRPTRWSPGADSSCRRQGGRVDRGDQRESPVREPDHVPPDRQTDHPRQPQTACRRHRRGALAAPAPGPLRPAGGPAPA